MATIYRFIIEQKAQADNGGRRSTNTSGKATKGAAKKGKSISLFGGEKGGVEHNRKLRAINPLINKATYGAWEKGMRATRAGIGLVKSAKEDGLKGVFGGPALVILIQMVLLGLLKWQEFERDKATKQNIQNFKQLENGVGAIHGAYEVSTHILTGRQTYNQNK